MHTKIQKVQFYRTTDPDSSTSQQFGGEKEGKIVLDSDLTSRLNIRSSFREK